MAKFKSMQMDEFRFDNPDDEGARLLPKEEPFRILLMGDFRGGAASPQPLKERRPVEIDRDNYPTLLSQWRPSVTVPLGGGESTVLRFGSLEEFEPDHLYRTMPTFASLLELRNRLHDPAGFPAAKKEIERWGRTAEAETPAENDSPVASENLLEQLLQKEDQSQENDRSAASLIPGFSEWDRFIRDTVAPYVIAAPDARVGDYEKIVDAAIGARMSTILHHPEFQELEAIWRGLDLLTRRLETDERMKVYLLDASAEELQRDLSESAGLKETGLCKHWILNAVDKPWALIAGHYSFGPNQADLELLGNLAQLAAKAKVTFLAAGQDALLGCSSLAETPDPREWQTEGARAKLWQQIRQFPPAAHIALALPRYLLRLPYGERTAPIQSFQFEEWRDGSCHEDYLWGNPAFLAALMLGQSFTSDGWDMRPGAVGQVGDLPIHVYDEDGERVAKPVAELALRDNALDAIIAAGVIPLISDPGRDVVRVAVWQSLTGEPLAGRWTG